MKKLLFAAIVLSGCQEVKKQSYCNLKLNDTLVNSGDMRLSYNKGTKQYAIKLKNHLGDVFLWKTLGGITWHYDAITTFSDSCDAKELSYEYIKEWERESASKFD